MTALNLLETCYSLFHQDAATSILPARLWSPFRVRCNEHQGKARWEKAIMPQTLTPHWHRMDSTKDFSHV